MLKGTHRNQSGDTLIEVLISITVFALVVVSSLGLMNQGTASSQRSLEMTLVTQQVEAQAETLRFLHESYITNYQQGYASTPGLSISGPAGQYYRIVQRLIPLQEAGVTQASEFGNPTGTSCPARPAGSFILNTRTARLETGAAILQDAQTYPQLEFSTTTPASLVASKGVWIEGIRSPVSTDPLRRSSGYIDFHIRACWYTPGLATATTFGTIVRLYEPRS